MNKLNNKGKHGIAFLVVLALVLQIAGPMVADFAYAMDSGEQEEKQNMEIINGEEPKPEGNGSELGSEEDEKIQEENEEAEDGETATGEEATEDSEVEEELEEEKSTEAIDSDDENKKDAKTDEKNKEEIDEKDKGGAENNKSEEPDVGKHGFILELNNATDLDGNPFDEGHQLELDDEFYLDLAWNLEDGHNYKEGDIEIFELPHGIKIQEEFEIELKSDGLDVAKAIIKTDGTVELTFTDFVETHSKVKGHMQIVSMIDEENAKEEDGNIILNPIGDEGEIRIPIDLGDRKKTIEKEGTPNKGYNADEINWEVIINKQKNNLTNATVTDILPKGTEFKEGSLKVTKLDVDLRGNIKGDLEEIEISGDSVEDGTLDIPLGDIKDPYRIEYVTKVTDEEQKEFKNNVTLTDNDLDDVSAKSTVTINRGEPIKKSAAKGYNPKTGIINWEIEFNFNQKDLKDITLEDKWTPEGKMSLVEDSLKFQEVSIDENGKAHNEGDAINLLEGADLVNGDDQFEVTGITTDKAYKVTYQTKINDRVLDDFKISNTAGFGTESNGSGSQVGAYYGSKSAGNIDYKNKTIDWTIELNHDEYPMEQISILDTLGDSLTLDKDSIKITVDGKKYEGDYSVSDDNPFELKFPKEFTTDKKIVIKYKTNFVADEVTNNLATNKADLTWTPEGGSDSITKEVKANKKLNKKTEDNSWKNGSYNPDTKEITWTIFTNYRENSLGNLIIKDEPQGNQQIVEDSAVVKELNIASNGNISEGKTLDNVSTIDGDNNILDVNIGKTDKAYKIEYKTSLEGLSDIQKEYVNQAEVLDGDESLSEIDAKVGIAKAHTYAAKSGKQDGKQVNWAVTVNPGQQKVQNLKLEDKVSNNQDILGDTFKVYEADVDGKGNASKKGDPISSDRYELTHEDGEPTFTVEWKDTVERAFVVEYSTLFFAGHNEDVTNSYDVTGDSIVEDGNTDGTGTVKIKQFGSGSGEGTAGYLVVDKVDSTYGQEKTKLDGAKFDLIDADTGNVLKSGTTNENGQIDFGRLLFGDYELKETKVPEGYVTPKETQTITIDKAYDSTKDKADYLYEVENYVPVFAVELSKTGKDNEALKDAEFTLFDSDDNELQTKETDKDGKILFEDIENTGDYYVQETKAPKGYVLDETKHNLTIGNKEPKPVKVYVKNKERGAVQLTKTDQDTGKVLQGVDFVLQKENDSGSYDTVKTYTTDKNGQIKTSNTLGAGNYQFVEEKGLDGYRTEGKPVKFTVNVNSTKTQKLTMTNEQYKGSVKLIKKDAATNEELKGAEFKLVDGDGKIVEKNLSTNKKGEVTVDELFLGDYQLIETKSPEGYELDETPINVKITEDNEVVEKTMMNKKLMNISVAKEWNNDSKGTEAVTIKLLPTEETIELNKANEWNGTFEGLYVYDEAGNEIDYQVEEIAVDGYNSSITGDANDGFTVTNTEVTKVEGTKTWKDEHKNDRPETIEIELLANKKKIDETEITAQSNSDYSFTNLDKFDENGDEISYTINEVDVDGYETNIDGYNIENVRKATTSVDGEKTWKDENVTDRPDSIDVNLTREVKGETDKDFSKTQTVKPNNQGNWKYVFDELDEFNENGVAYTYIIEEDNVSEKYESIVDDHDITNVRIGETEVSGTKRWKDDKVEDRPEKITVNLLRNNVPVESKDVSADDSWKYSFTELDKYDQDGKYYEYKISEEQVPGYAPNITGNDITNTRSEKTSIEITKGWLDGDSKDRPNSVIVYVYQNKKLFDTVEIEADKDWVYELTDIEAYDADGQPYTYTVKEKAIKGYNPTVNGFNITNLRVGKRDIEVNKAWIGPKAEKIEVTLYADGEITGETLTLNEENEWKGNFKDLERYNNVGELIDYTVVEADVENNDSEVTGSMEDAFTVTNTNNELTDIEVNKAWIGAKTEEVEIKLLADGETTGETLILNEANEWKGNFKNLDKYNKIDGDLIEYTVEEAKIDGYDVTITGDAKDGFTVKNTENMAKASVEVSKEWIGTEQDSVTINLMDGKRLLASKELKSDNDWTYTFSDLDKYDNVTDKNEIDYTVKEVPVEGYKTSITGSAEEGYKVTNTELIDIPVEKIWELYEKETEEVTINLLANNDEVDSVKLNEANDWKYEFKDLAAADSEGTIKYSVEEIEVEGFEGEITGDTAEGFTLTNTEIVPQTPIVPGTTTVDVEKVWVGKEKEEVTVNLLADGEKVDSVKLSKDNNWKHTFTDLPVVENVTDETVISYTVEEVKIDGYDVSITGDAKEGYVVTNTEKPEDPEDPEGPDKDDPTDPSDPEDLEDPTTPGGPTDPSDPEDPTDPDKPHEDGDLVQTGTDINFLIPIGMTIMLIGLAFVFREKFIKE